ncbi:hypothetical protein, partial [Mycobacterium tuberculosis]|uniref:hypothetical protein n=1 Tax=Mycobacterium tuberculosis TaxID=1773 RepID=UPI002549E016
NFKAVAEKLRSDYDFSHVKDAKLLPKGDLEVKGPVVRLLKPFDELFVDTQDFDVDALEKFVEVAGTPLVTVYNKDPANHPYVVKFFNNENTKAMFFVNFALDNFEALKSKFYEVASSFKGKDISFLLG